MQDPNDSKSILRGEGPSGLKQFATRFCISITIALGLLAAGECVSYLLLPHQVPSISDYQAYVIWQTARPIEKTRTVAADGLRLTYYSHCEAGEFTIWMFGGSNLWGQFNIDQETIPSLIAKHYDESGHRVCVRNYGQIGWASTQEVIKLMLELKRAERKPDVVIFYDGAVDSFLPYESDMVDVHMGFPTFKKKFESWRAGDQAGFEYLRSTNTYLGLQWIATKLKINNDAGVPRSISGEQAAAMAQRTLDNYERNMKIVEILAGHYGFHFECFWEPWLLAELKPLSPEEELIRIGVKEKTPGLAALMSTTYGLFRTAKQPHLVYLGDIFKDHRETLFLDRTHLTGEGNQIIAERISQILQ